MNGGKGGGRDRAGGGMGGRAGVPEGDARVAWAICACFQVSPKAESGAA